MSVRFENTGEVLSSFADDFLVCCPRCSNCARVLKLDVDASNWVSPRRVVCLRCAYTLEQRVAPYGTAYTGRPDQDLTRLLVGAPVDWFFQQSLWLQSPCCGETLWAYNHRHLAYLERYVQADMRDECSYPSAGLARYLPQWMKSAKNRNEVLRCIDGLKRL